MSTLADKARRLNALTAEIVGSFGAPDCFAERGLAPVSDQHSLELPYHLHGLQWICMGSLIHVFI
jgi:hypothetical protein